MNKAKIRNTILVWVILLISVVTSPFMVIPYFRISIYWKYLWTHRCLVFKVRETAGKKIKEMYNRSAGLAIAAYGISIVGLSPMANIGILYHELGHCVDPRAFNARGHSVHAHITPDPSEVAADMYAVSNGYGQELFDALKPFVGICPDVRERLRFIRCAIDELSHD